MFRRTLMAATLAAGLIPFAASAATVPLHATLNGASEVPAKQTKGTGTMTGTLDTATKKLTYDVTFKDLSGPATAAHFHGPAAAGANAGVVLPLGNNPTSPITGSATLTDKQMADLQSGMMYVNVHTKENPGGEIRGQVEKGQ